MVVADILQWACELPATEVAFHRDAQILATRALGDLPTLAAQQQMRHSESNIADVIKDLQQAIADSEQLLLAQGIPAAVAKLGRLNVDSFQYNWQMFDDSRTTLDALAGGIASPTVWEGNQARYWNLRGVGLLRGAARS